MSFKHQPFDGTESTLRSSLISDEELRDVLCAIEESQFQDEAHKVSPYDDWVTISAISEATGHSTEEIEEVLIRIRRETLSCKISQRLRELEEPLYRVERPGHHKPDPSAPAIRITQINTILDKILPESKKTARTRKNLEITATDRIASGIAIFVGLIVVLGTIGLIVMTVLNQ